MASSFASAASTTPSAIISPNYTYKCSSSSSCMLSFHLSHKTKLPLFTKVPPPSRIVLPRVKVEPDDVSIFHWPSIENALSEAIYHLLNKLLGSSFVSKITTIDSSSNATVDNKTIAEVARSVDNDAKTRSSEGVLATEKSISNFITHVASLVKLVDSRDIVELQLKKLDCEVIIRKQEAMPQPQAPTEVAMLNLPPHTFATTGSVTYPTCSNLPGESMIALE